MRADFEPRDICLWPLDSCLNHDAATRKANGCPRRPEHWRECVADDRIHPLEAAAIASMKGDRQAEPIG